jgi:hypothetical protein
MTKKWDRYVEEARDAFTPEVRSVDTKETSGVLIDDYSKAPRLMGFYEDQIYVTTDTTMLDMDTKETKSITIKNHKGGFYHIKFDGDQIYVGTS